MTLPLPFSEPNCGLVDPLEKFSLSHPHLEIGSSIVQHDNLVLHMVNHGSHTITIPKDTHVAELLPATVMPDCTDTCNLLGEEGVPPLSSTADRHNFISEYLHASCSHLPAPTLQSLEALLHTYHDVFALSSTERGLCTVSPHTIDTGSAPPIKQAVRRLPYHQRDALRGVLDGLLETGTIAPSSSPWAAPIVLVKKKDGSPRLCVDYRKLNKVTRPDAYPLPRTDDIIDSFSGCTSFSTLDLASGYWQIAMADTDKCKTAFTTPLGLYEFHVMPMGCTNGPATFQRVMEHVLRDVLASSTRGSVCRVFFDDIAVAAQDTSECLSQLRRVFDCLRHHHLKLRLSKCQFLQPNVGFLGVDISAAGVRTSADKISAVTDWPLPKSIKEVRSFLGLCSYYRRFVPSFAKIAAPLHALTANNATFHWSAACTVSFRMLKQRLTSAPILAYPDVSSSAAPFILDTDASALAMGAVLSQSQEGSERVIQYASKCLSKAQRNYSATERELLAFVHFIDEFRHYLLGRPFIVRTDHAALRWLQTLSEPRGRRARWIELLSEYNFTVEHRPGRLHLNADALSRRPPSSSNQDTSAPPTTVCAISSFPSYSSPELREAQESDPDLQCVLEWYDPSTDTFVSPSEDAIAGSSHAVRHLWADIAFLRVKDGVLFRVCPPDPSTAAPPWQLVVPFALREAVLASVHSDPGGGGGTLGMTKQSRNAVTVFTGLVCRLMFSFLCAAVLLVLKANQLFILLLLFPLLSLAIPMKLWVWIL